MPFPKRALFAVFALLSMAGALVALYSTDNIGGARAAALAGILMMILLPGLTVGAIVVDRRTRGGR